MVGIASCIAPIGVATERIFGKATGGVGQLWAIENARFPVFVALHLVAYVAIGQDELVEEAPAIAVS